MLPVRTNVPTPAFVKLAAPVPIVALIVSTPAPYCCTMSSPVPVAPPPINPVPIVSEIIALLLPVMSRPPELKVWLNPARSKVSAPPEVSKVSEFIPLAALRVKLPLEAFRLAVAESVPSNAAVPWPVRRTIEPPET